MKAGLMGSATLLLAVGASLGLPPRIAGAEAPAPSQPKDAVALIGNVPVTEAELDASLSNELLALRTEEFNIRQRVLGSLIARALLEGEAAARKINVEDLTRIEISEKARGATDSEVRSTYDSFKEHLQGMSEAEGLEKVKSYLVQRALYERRAEFLRTLREREKVRVLLEPPRVPLANGEGPSLGPKGAPVTIMEFADLECPYGGRVVSTLRRLQQRYGDRLRLVFKDFPLPIHVHAGKAAEAGACAVDQGKFWEMHDKIFANQKALEVADLKALAREIGLEDPTFAECLDSGRHASTWRGSAEEGKHYGIAVTPAFFINGRLLTGAQPLDAFLEVIDDELERRSQASPSLRRRRQPCPRGSPLAGDREPLGA